MMGISHRAVHLLVMWLVAWMTMQLFGQVLSVDGMLEFFRTRYRRTS